MNSNHKDSNLNNPNIFERWLLFLVMLTTVDKREFMWCYSTLIGYQKKNNGSFAFDYSDNKCNLSAKYKGGKNGVR